MTIFPPPINTYTYLGTQKQKRYYKQKPLRLTEGVDGVYFSSKDSMWEVKIGVGGKQVGVGRFDNKLDAIKARRAAEKKYGYYDGHGI